MADIAKFYAKMKKTKSESPEKEPEEMDEDVLALDKLFEERPNKKQRKKA